MGRPQNNVEQVSGVHPSSCTLANHFIHSTKTYLSTTILPSYPGTEKRVQKSKITGNGERRDIGTVVQTCSKNLWCSSKQNTTVVCAILLIVLHLYCLHLSLLLFPRNNNQPPRPNASSAPRPPSPGPLLFLVRFQQPLPFPLFCSTSLTVVVWFLW